MHYSLYPALIQPLHHIEAVCQSYLRMSWRCCHDIVSTKFQVESAHPSHWWPRPGSSWCSRKGQGHIGGQLWFSWGRNTREIWCYFWLDLPGYIKILCKCFWMASYVITCVSLMVLPQLSLLALLSQYETRALFRNGVYFLAATKQLYKWYFPSVCPSVRLSVCPSVRLSVTPFWLCSHHRIIMKLSGVITNDRRKVHAKGQGQRSKVKVTEVMTQLNRFRTVTPVWIHICWWNDAYSLMLLRRGALLFFEVIRQISRSHGSKNRGLWPSLGVSGL